MRVLRAFNLLKTEHILKSSGLIVALCLLPLLASAQQVDCSAAYSGKTAHCVPVPCGRYQGFLGVWKGPFEAYSQELSKNGKTIFRPYETTVTYRSSDCLKNPALGEIFILGHVTDVYSAFSGLPARTEHTLLITGEHSDGSRFLRTVDEKKSVSNFHLDYQNKAASMAVWSLSIPAHGNAPEMDYSIIDGREFTATGTNRRNVVITLRVGPKTQPYFDGVIAYGHHTLQK